MQVTVNCLPSDWRVNTSQSDHSINCLPSDFNLNVSGLYNGTSTVDVYRFIVDESDNQIVDESGNLLVARVEQSEEEYGIIVANCLPSDWNINA